MISLDKQILDSNSRVADRMKDYGKTDEIFIVVPSREKKIVDLSPSVHVESAVGGKVGQFFRLYNLGKKIIKNNRIETITAQDPFFTGLIGVLLRRRFNIPLEVQAHGDFYGSGYYRTSGLGNWLRYWLGRWVLGRADRVRAVSQRVRESLLTLGVSTNKIELRPIRADLDFIRNYQTRLDLCERYPGYEKIFLVLGRLESVKNISWLIDVFKEVLRQKNRYLLLIVGGGKEESKIKLQVISYKLQDNIKFESWTNDPISYLKTADCLLFPSLSEGYGLVAMEAAAAGTKVIMTDVGVANYELKSASPKVTIVPVGDRDKFIEAMLKICPVIQPRKFCSAEQKEAAD